MSEKPAFLNEKSTIPLTERLRDADNQLDREGRIDTERVIERLTKSMERFDRFREKHLKNLHDKLPPEKYTQLVDVLERTRRDFTRELRNVAMNLERFMEKSDRDGYARYMDEILGRDFGAPIDVTSNESTVNLLAWLGISPDNPDSREISGWMESHGLARDGKMIQDGPIVLPDAYASQRYLHNLEGLLDVSVLQNTSEVRWKSGAPSSDPNVRAYVQDTLFAYFLSRGDRERGIASRRALLDEFSQWPRDLATGKIPPISENTSAEDLLLSARSHFSEKPKSYSWVFDRLDALGNGIGAGVCDQMLSLVRLVGGGIDAKGIEQILSLLLHDPARALQEIRAILWQEFVELCEMATDAWEFGHAVGRMLVMAVIAVVTGGAATASGRIAEIASKCGGTLGKIGKGTFSTLAGITETLSYATGFPTRVLSFGEMASMNLLSRAKTLAGELLYFTNETTGAIIIGKGMHFLRQLRTKSLASILTSTLLGPFAKLKNVCELIVLPGGWIMLKIAFDKIPVQSGEALLWTRRVNSPDPEEQRSARREVTEKVAQALWDHFSDSSA